MNREQLRQAADREALAIWDRAKLPGDGAVWIADAIVRVAERYARDEDRFSAVVEAKRECTRLAAEVEPLRKWFDTYASENTSLRAQLASEKTESAETARRLIAECERIRAQLAKARKEGVDSDARAQAACQTIIETIGSCGAENVEEAALRIAPKLAERDAEIERLRKAIVREHDGQEALAQSASKMMTVMHEVAAELRDAYGRDDWHDIEAIAQKLDSAANGETKIDLTNETETACEAGLVCDTPCKNCAWMYEPANGETKTERGFKTCPACEPEPPSEMTVALCEESARLTQERDAARAEVEKLRETLAKIREVLG